MTPQIYYIYGRYKGQKSFALMNLSKGTQTKRKIFASRMTKEQADKFMANEAPRNAPDWEFQVRPVPMPSSSRRAA